MATVNLPTGFEERMTLSTSYSQEARLRQVEFGDGYIQRTPLGINGRRRSMSANWDNLTESEYATLFNTLDSAQVAGDCISLSYDHILFRAGKFMIESLEVQSADGTNFSVSASLTEVHDL
jgi:hypothetical protein